MKASHGQILYFISLIRESAPQLQKKIFTNGACYQFYFILKEKFPDAVPFYDMNHVITRIGSKYYDINGEYADAGRHAVLEQTPKDWGRRFQT